MILLEEVEVCGKEGGSWVDSEMIRMSFRFGEGVDIQGKKKGVSGKRQEGKEQQRKTIQKKVIATAFISCSNFFLYIYLFFHPYYFTCVSSSGGVSIPPSLPLLVNFF